MQRRKFIKNTTAGMMVGAGLWSNTAIANGFFSSTIEADKSLRTKKITILHTNDTHSHIEPINGGRNDGRGGVARRAALINKVRAENPNTLLLDCGDIFQGTPYFNFFGGELEIKLMTMMGYDAATIGNHDFDNGIDGLYKQLPHADFDFVISNYDFSNTIMDGKTRTHRVFVKDDVRIGLFGIGIELQGLVAPSMYKETQYLDPVERARDMVKMLREEENCDLVICMSHLGYSYRGDKVSDISLAKATSGIDLIIGGHTHTFLDKPELVTNAAGKTVMVNQVGCYGINVGRIDFYMNQGNLEAGSEVVYEI
ncbi:bifunctional metallophosphatase/5'-nucleotidase [Nonlabens ponticola]|uniref:Bifunctional metallophosphatase/5'-nucleotidase n=1 Tax=Nonlabens ponticola TaxID=2496866 RepID=A0A3S9N0Y7_9FLAO|nr:metallophosphatase [Nonlabens ponticola]AZQ45196.1 bifunctional metallophosphatase/5'-nucleotidase [Nonlabens ponticola]